VGEQSPRIGEGYQKRVPENWRDLRFLTIFSRATFNLHAN
jgi:hypothetical protein